MVSLFPSGSLQLKLFSSPKMPARFCQPVNTDEALEDTTIERKLTLFERNLPPLGWQIFYLLTQ
jgi:hypothetical protein